MTSLSPILDEALSENVTERAQMRFKQAVVLAGQMRRASVSWVVLGGLLVTMEASGDLQRLGFGSITACIEAIEHQTGYSRARMSDFVKLYRDATRNGVELPEMRPATGHIFKQLPAQLQRDPEIREAATSLQPDHFHNKIAKEHPEAHIERSITLKFPFSRMQVMKRVAAYYRRVEDSPDLSDQEAWEHALVDYELIRTRLEEFERDQEQKGVERSLNDQAI